MTPQTVRPSPDRIRLLCGKTGQEIPPDVDTMTEAQLAAEDARLQQLPRLSAASPADIEAAFGVSGDKGWTGSADR